jgi:hypothetical protein
MKTITSISLFLFSFYYFSQNYYPVNSTFECSFKNSFTNEYVFLKTINSTVENNIKTYDLDQDFYHTNIDFELCLGQNLSELGKKISIDTINHWTYFIPLSDDSILLKNNAILNETWVAHLFDDNSYLECVVSNISFQNVLDQMDSIKTFTFNMKDQFGNLQPHNINNKQVKISKHYGVVQYVPMIEFPNTIHLSTLYDYNLTGNVSSGVGVLNFYASSIFNFELNDEFHFKKTSSAMSMCNDNFFEYSKDKYLASNFSNDTLFVTIERKNLYYNKLEEDCSSTEIFTNFSYFQDTIQDTLIYSNLDNEYQLRANPLKLLSGEFTLGGENFSNGIYTMYEVDKKRKNEYMFYDNCLSQTSDCNEMAKYLEFQKGKGIIKSKYNRFDSCQEHGEGYTLEQVFSNKNGETSGLPNDFCSILQLENLVINSAENFDGELYIENYPAYNLSSNSEIKLEWYRNDTLLVDDDNNIEYPVNGIYQLNVSLDGCVLSSNILSITDSPFTGISEKNHAVFTIIPNPSSDFIQVKGTKTVDYLAIFDCTSKQVSKEMYSFSGNKIDIRNLEAGMYFLLLNGESYKFVKK